MADSYVSVIEAVKHAAYYFNRKPVIEWLNAETYETKPHKLQELKEFDGVVVPGGFGGRGVEGKIAVINYCRRNKIPFLGLCYGMQLAVVEFARNVAGFKKANTTEVNLETPYSVIDILPEQKQKLAKKITAAVCVWAFIRHRLKRDNRSRGLQGIFNFRKTSSSLRSQSRLRRALGKRRVLFFQVFRRTGT